jgi:hypothetical protein
MRRALRNVCGALLIVSLCWSAVSTAKLFETGVARVWVDRQTDRIAAEVDRQIVRHATAETVAARVRGHLDADPRNWLALDALLEEAAQAGIALPKDLAAEVEAARTADFSWMARTGNCLGCAWNAERCSFDLVMLCRTPFDLTVLGDIKGLADEGGKSMRGEELDEVILILSAVGLSATALVLVTGGGSMTIKAGAGLAKIARGMGAMPGWMARTLTDAARRGVDWAGIPGIRSADDVMALLRLSVLRPTVRMLDDAGRVVKKAGPAGGLYLISKTADAAELAKLGRVSEAIHARTVGTVEILGKSRVLRAAIRLSDEAVQLAVGLLSALAALIGLILSSASSAALRGARRVLR